MLRLRLVELLMRLRMVLGLLMCDLLMLHVLLRLSLLLLVLCLTYTN